MSVRCALIVIAATGLVLGGCSTRPRQFAPTLKSPASDQVTYDRDYQTCQTLVGRGYKSNFKATALTLGIGTAAGVAGAVAASAVAIASTTPTLATLGFNTTAAGVGAATIALPVIGIGVGFGVSRAIRSGREKRVKAALASCLSEYGHSVDSWTLVKKTKKIKGQKTTPTPIPAVADTPVG